MNIIAKKINDKFGNPHKASKELGESPQTLQYWVKKNPKEMSSKLIKKIAKALNEDVDKLRLEILNN